MKNVWNRMSSAQQTLMILAAGILTVFGIGIGCEKISSNAVFYTVELEPSQRTVINAETDKDEDHVVVYVQPPTIGVVEFLAPAGCQVNAPDESRPLGKTGYAVIDGVGHEGAAQAYSLDFDPVWHDDTQRFVVWDCPKGTQHIQIRFIP